ncbi:MAG: hypothetical protein R3Y29_05975, partial [bacterium]
MKSKIIINRKNVALGLCSAMALSSLPMGVVFADDSVGEELANVSEELALEEEITLVDEPTAVSAS